MIDRKKKKKKHLSLFPPRPAMASTAPLLRPISAASLAARPTEDADAPAALPAGWFSWRALAAFVGPGVLASIAFLDPGNLESLLQVCSCVWG